MTRIEIPSMHDRANMPLISCAGLLPGEIPCLLRSESEDHTNRLEDSDFDMAGSSSFSAKPYETVTSQ